MSAESADLLTFIQFVRAFTVARWIDEHLLKPLGKLVWAKVSMWWLMLGTWKQFKQDFKTVWGKDESHGD